MFDEYRMTRMRILRKILQASTSFSQLSNNVLKGKSTSGNVVGNPSNELIKPSTGDSSKKKESIHGSSLLMPKIILKPPSATDQPSKKPHTGSAENPLPKDGVSKNNDSASSESTNVLLSLCQNYDSDGSG